LEIEAALSQNMPIIPVLVGRAQMPEALTLPEELGDLAFLNAAEVRAGSSYDAQVDKLLEGVLTIWREEGATRV
jgi:hypothetical protein